jgi:hypothetical protein
MMSGDYTRFTFRPRDGYAGVLSQQGRVQVDADWNELWALLDRRLRAQLLDLYGRCGVPRRHPDGFRITRDAGGRLHIGVGRAYVDGLMAENHGTAPDLVEPVWGEVRGEQPTPYDAQPFREAGLAQPSGGGPHLVYLDVWQREVTAAVEPALVDKAIGIDTATRIQTVWQVRVLEDVGTGVTCATDLATVPGWEEATAPSAGRLTTVAVEPPEPDDPCSVAAEGGYRGVENRLYRVEIHDGGGASDTPTFKWSRDNASVAVRVVEISGAASPAPRVTVTRLGRDEVLRFRRDDWVEITDDLRELEGLPGVMAQVDTTDPTANVVVLRGPLSAGIDTARNARLRRWDQQGGVNAEGVLPIGALPAEFSLEHGIEVTFRLDPAGGRFRPGDHWVFAARATDGSIEQLDAAPPRGVRHHYCALAVLQGTEEPQDCRRLWPDEPHAAEGCDCTVCVTEESHASGELTLQDAVDRAGRGGKVCVGAGLFHLAEPLRVEAAQALRIEGRGWPTVLVHQGAGSALSVRNSAEVALERMTIVAAPQEQTDEPGHGACVHLHNCVAATVRHCNLLQIASLRAVAPMLADVEVSAPVVGLSGILVQTTVSGNVIFGDTGIGTLGRPVMGDKTHLGAATTGYVDHGIAFIARLYVEDNLLVCTGEGIGLSHMTIGLLETRIARNAIHGCGRGGIVALASHLTGYPLGTRLDVSDNAVGTGASGIVVTTGETRVEGNLVSRQAVRWRSEELGFYESGILVVPGLLSAVASDEGRGHLARVSGNRVDEVPGHGIIVSAEGTALVSGNLVQGVGGVGIGVTSPPSDDFTRVGDRVERVTVAGNQLVDVSRGADEETPGGVGIGVEFADAVDVADNRVHGVARDSARAGRRAGIAIIGCASVRIAGNDVVEIGPEYQDGVSDDPWVFAAGIDVEGSFDRVDVLDNRVRRSSVRDQESDHAAWVAVRIGSWIDPVKYGVASEVAESIHGYAAADEPSLAGMAGTEEVVHAVGNVAMIAFADEVAYIRGLEVLTLPRGLELVAVRGNMLETHGGTPAVQVEAGGTVTLGDNRCIVQADAACIAAVCGAAILHANYLEGRPDLPAARLYLPQGAPVTALGNIGSGPVVVNGTPIGAPWSALNVVAS